MDGRGANVQSAGNRSRSAKTLIKNVKNNIDKYGSAWVYEAGYDNNVNQDLINYQNPDDAGIEISEEAGGDPREVRLPRHRIRRFLQTLGIIYMHK